MRINIMHSKWGSHAMIAEWLADAFMKKGHEVTVYARDWHKFKTVEGEIIFIGGEPRLLSYLNACRLYHRKALYWIDFFVFRSFMGYKIQEKEYRALGGKLVCCSNTEREYLEEAGITVDAVIPRCVSDDAFNYKWIGLEDDDWTGEKKEVKKEVLSIGFTDYRRDNRIYCSINPPKELDNVTRKGHELLVEFASNNPDWNVKLVTSTKELRKAIEIPELSNLELIEAGTLTQEQKYELIANTGVFCLPTRLDSNPLVVMEAQAIGTPTCYTALPPLIEMGGGFEIPVREIYWYPSGLYLAVIEYGELEKVIEKTRIFAEAIGGFGRMNARKYKASVVADKLLEVLE